MMLKKLAATLALAGLAAFTTGAIATPTINNNDGMLSPFNGFDWASNSTAWTSGFNALTATTGDKFTLYYAAYATALLDDGGNVLAAPRLDNIANGAKSYGALSYEYTIFATLKETVVSCSVGTCTFQIDATGSTFDVYYDTAANAKTVKNGVWSGFQDGTKIISGTIGSSVDTFSNLTGGQANLNGQVGYTNNAFVNPDLVNTNFTSTLQLTTSVTGFKTPTGVDAFTIGAGDVVFQADSNQTFTVNETPEPAALALAGLALGACGLASRRRKSN